MSVLMSLRILGANYSNIDVDNFCDHLCSAEIIRYMNANTRRTDI